jgi:methionyl-tRNA synthetase
MDKFYITCAIPYVNAAPHIGHALEFIQGDAFARYHRLLGQDTLLLSGGDENALKNVQAAEKAGIPVQQFIDENNIKFFELTKLLGCQFDVWQKGSDVNHHFKSSQKLWELCDKNGDIYSKSYEGLYCVGCEAFYTTEELNENGECFEHPGKKLETVQEKNYFFNLKKYQKRLLDILKGNDKEYSLNIIPEKRKNEVISFVEGGLEDVSISRSNERAKNWGVPVPNDDTQRMYVWFDALNIYQSGIGFGWDDAMYKKWWPADAHVIGKGITRFHAVYWPAFLLSAGLPLPKNIFVHEYFTVNGQKMSKTLGNVIDPVGLIQKYGSDPLRYYFLAKFSPFNDGDFSEDEFIKTFNSDLANGLGNTASRIAKLADGLGDISDTEIPKNIYSDTQTKLFHEFRFDLILNAIWTTEIDAISKHIDQEKPWTIKDAQKRKEILQKDINLLRIIATKLQPFLPETSKKILNQFKGPTIQSIEPLFKRLT